MLYINHATDQGINHVVYKPCHWPGHQSIEAEAYGRRQVDPGIIWWNSSLKHLSVCLSQIWLYSDYIFEPLGAPKKSLKMSLNNLDFLHIIICLLNLISFLPSSSLYYHFSSHLVKFQPQTFKYLSLSIYGYIVIIFSSL